MYKLKELLTLVLLSFSIIAFSQSINEAGKEFNDGINSAKAGNVEAAIESYNSCINICNILGFEGDDLKSKAQSQLTSIYYKRGVSSYKKKDFTNAIKSFKKSAEIANANGDTKSANKATRLVPKVYYTKGMTQLKKKDFANSLVSLNKAIKISPKYTKAYYGKVLVFKYKDDAENLILATNKIMEVGNTGDKYVNKAKSVTHKYFLANGAEALKKMKYTSAVKNLNLSLDYGTPDADTYYYLALSYNGIKKWDDAVKSAKKAIELKKEGKSDIYFVLGKALEGKSENAAACYAYKKVTDGPNLEAAKYQIEHSLKCN